MPMNDLHKKKIKKYIEFFLTKIKIIYAQRIFHFEGVKVKYMYKKVKDSKALLIVFSACTRNGLRARYNYVKTLSGVACNRLFILDDWASDHRGSYYLGKNFTFDEEKATNALIDKIIKMQSTSKVMYCGSSKGGYAALNFGLQHKNSIIISGGPQYHLYKYLKAGNEAALNHIMGNYSDAKAAAIDNHLKNVIEKDDDSGSQVIYLHFSDQEHTYSEHIADLLEELKKKDFVIIEDVAKYTNHSDISLYFPDFLINTVNKEIH